MLHKFPLDIWNYIIEFGHLTIQDVLNLLVVNKQLHLLLKHNSVWQRIVFAAYLDSQLQFGLHAATATNTNFIDYFKLCMKFYHKDLKYRNAIKNNNPDIRYFLDMFSTDSDYLPILYRYYQELPSTYLAANLSLAEKSITKSLLQAQCALLGFSYFDKIFQGSVDVNNPLELENFWFHTSLLDKNCHRLVHSRAEILNKVFSLLHKEIEINTFFNRSRSLDIQLVPVDGEKDVLILLDGDTLMQLIIQIFRLTLSCLEFSNPLMSTDDPVVYDKYTNSYFLEDFSILRVYNGQVKGHPFIIMAILIKVINEFLFSKYHIKFEGLDHYEKVQINMTSTYLRVRNHLFSFDRTALSSYTNFNVYSIDEVVSHLRDRSYFEISKFIEPLEFKYVVECFLHLDTFMDARSLNTILRPDYYFNQPLVALKRFSDYDFDFITPHDYSFMKLICRYLQDINSNNDFLDKMFCSEFEATMNRLNNLIYFNVIHKIFKGTPSKLQKFEDHFLEGRYDWVFSKTFDLHDANSKISLRRILKHCPYSEVGHGIFIPGVIVHHTKFDTYGILLGRVITNNDNVYYYRVFTTKKTMECYNVNSISVIDSRTKNLDYLVNFVIKSCGEDILGTLFFNKLVYNDYPRFMT